MGFFDTEEREFDLVPAGIHVAKIDDVKLDETKEHPKLSVTYKLQNNRLIWQNFTINEKSQKWISWQLGIMGAWQLAKESCKDTSSMSNVARACLDAIGEKMKENQMFEMLVEHREWQDKTFANAKLERVLEREEAAALVRELKNKKPIKNHAPTLDKNDDFDF